MVISFTKKNKTRQKEQRKKKGAKNDCGKGRN
jgi:hypothetical protein